MSKPRFSGKRFTASPLIESAKAQFGDRLDASQLQAAIQNQKPFKLKDGTEVLYGRLQGNQVISPFRKAQKLVEAGLAGSGNANAPVANTPFFVEAGSSQTEAALHKVIKDLLPEYLRNSYVDPKTKLESTNVIYSDLIEKLLSGNFKNIPDGKDGTPNLQGALSNAFQGKLVQCEVNPTLGQQAKTIDFQGLDALYTICIPGQTNAALQLNNQQSEAFRRRLIGLDLARKVYSEGQEAEWKSVALALAIGGIAEPTVSHVFNDGGTTASIIRTTLLSGVDITGNVLSVMGVINEKLKEKGKKLSLESIFGSKEQRTWKSLFEMKGDVGNDLRQGIRTGGARWPAVWGAF